MNIRRKRVHQNGLTNIDRSVTSEVNDYYSNIPILQGSHNNQIILESKNRSNSIQIRTQSSFKKEQSYRKTLPKIMKSFLKNNQIITNTETLDKDKNISQNSQLSKENSQSNTTLKNNVGPKSVDKTDKIENEINQEPAKSLESNSIFQKSFPKYPENIIKQKSKFLNGKIDLEKIKKVCKDIRLKYGSKAKFITIFSSKCYNSTEIIDYKDAFYILNKMGFSISLNESKVLLANIENEKPNIYDFCKMIYDPAENIKIDLNKIKENEENNSSLMKEIDANIRNIKYDSKIRYFKSQIQNNLYDLIKLLESSDLKRTNCVDYDMFCKAISSRIKLPEKLKSNSQIMKEIFNEYSNGNDYLNYLDFAKKITHMNDLSIHCTRVPFGKRQDEFGNINLLDITKLPPNKIEKIFLHTLKVNRMLKHKFATEEDLILSVQNLLNLKDKENKSIDHLSLQKYFKFIFEKEIKAKRILKEDLEGFLSCIKYNKNQVSNYNLLSELVFKKDSELLEMLCENTRNLPPNQEALDNIVSEKSTTNLKEDSVLKIIKDLEYKLFDTKYKIYDVYQKFDEDGDGYVSIHDLRNHLNKIDLKFNDSDFITFIKTLKIDQKGYLNFDDFRKQFGPNMSNQFDLQVNSRTNIPYITPSKEKILETIGFFKTKKNFANKSDNNPKTISRFSATPFNNSFINFRSQIAEDSLDNMNYERGDLNLKKKFQELDKQKQRSITEAKIRKIKKFQDLIKERIENDEILAINSYKKKFERKMKDK